MLILTRKKGQSILISNDIEIIVTAVENDQVKIGVKAPSHIKIFRKEIYDAVQQSNQEAVSQAVSLDQLRQMMNLEDA